MFPEVLMPDLTIWLPTYLNNNVKQCAFINPNHLQTYFRSILYSAAAASLSWHLAGGFRGEDLKKSSNQNIELLVAAMFVNGSRQNKQSLYKPSKVHFNEMMKMSALYCAITFSWMFIELVIKWWLFIMLIHWHYTPRQSLHSDTMLTSSQPGLVLTL
jgi:hypothetical protein